MDVLPVSFRTLTPLWLGDIDRSGSSAKESGLIGSLRFWCEGVVRSFGKRVCEDGRCSRDDADGLCTVCELFGTTSWTRRFRLELDPLQPVRVYFRASPLVAQASGNWLWNIFGGAKTGGTRPRTQGGQEFTFGVTALWSPTPCDIRIVPRIGTRADQISLLALTLRTAARLGGVGAKTQYGFGQIELTPESDAELRSLARQGIEFLERPSDVIGAAKSDKGFQPMWSPFTLVQERFFSIIYRFPSNPIPGGVDIGQRPTGHDDSYIPCSFDIRYKYETRNPRNGTGVDRGIRPAIADYFGSGEARRICGYVDGSDARASRIHVSHLYKTSGDSRYCLKIWGDAQDANSVLAVIHDHVMTRFRNAGVEYERLA